MVRQLCISAQRMRRTNVLSVASKPSEEWYDIKETRFFVQKYALSLLKNTRGCVNENYTIKNSCGFAANGLGVIGAGAIAGVPLWKACFMAGIAGVATVVEGLSRAYMDDGKLTLAEINDVFNKVDKKTKD